MTDNGIGAEGAKAMSEGLKVNTTLKELNLGGDEEGKVKRKEKERMTGNEIGAEGAKSMSSMLKVNTTLKTLNLGCENEGKVKRKEKEERMNNRQWDWR